MTATSVFAVRGLILIAFPGFAFALEVCVAKWFRPEGSPITTKMISTSAQLSVFQHQLNLVFVFVVSGPHN